MSKADLLNSLYKDIAASKVCNELALQSSGLVPGNGNLDAEIVIVGEAPGKAEDAEGKPFVGASGKFLDKMLEIAGIARKRIYITNIVKYRPPSNRDPSKSEKAEFWPYLLRELEIIQPKFIITLGRHSGMCFLPDLVIGRDHGQPKEVLLNEKSYVLVPLYHPAAALYNGNMRQTLIDDFMFTAKLLAQ